jgi:hypothetical protein
MLDDLFKTASGIRLMSVIWGFGLSCLFRKVCKDRNCIVLKAPKPNNVDNQVYKYDNTCYQFIPYNTKCINNTISV